MAAPSDKKVVSFNGKKYYQYKFNNGQSMTTNQICMLKEIKKDLLDKHPRPTPPRTQNQMLGCKNVSFAEAPRALGNMSYPEKEEWLQNTTQELREFLAVWWCKDCEDRLLRGEKPLSYCRHVRRHPSMPIVEQTLDKMANDGRRRTYNKYEALKMRATKFVRKVQKKLFYETASSEEEELLTFGDFDVTVDQFVDSLNDEEIRAWERRDRLEERLNTRAIRRLEYAAYKARQQDSEEWDEIELPPWVGENKLPLETPPERKMYLEALGARVRFIIEAYQSLRTGKAMSEARMAMLELKGNSFPVEEYVQLPKTSWQMDNGKSEELNDAEKPVVKQAGNVSLALAEEVPVPVAPTPQRMDQFTHVESNSDFEAFTSRMTQLTEFTWDASGIKLKGGTTASKLININVFSDIYNMLLAKKSPLVAPFKYYRFGRFDIELVFKISSTIMQAGTIQIALTYFMDKLKATELADAKESKVNAAILSQRPHELLTAHDTTEVTLKIPFRHWQTMLNLEATKVDDNKKLGNWQYATVSMNILNDLMVASSSCTGGTIAGQIYVRLSNVKFAGMIASGKNEMFSTAAFLLANQYLADSNRDLPGAYENPPRLQPTLCQSFAHGRSNLDHRDVLRLDPSVQTPHPEGVTDFSGDYIKSVPGLLDIKEWKQDAAAGHVLYQVECTPLLQKEKYILHKAAVKDVNPASYVMPPVAVWASDKMAFTGGLILTINVCTTKFSAGMLEVIYIPGNVIPSEIDVSNYMHVVLDIKENKTFHVATPSIINNPAWYRRYVGFEIGEDYDPPGFLVVRVNQPLASTCEVVPPDALLNFYISGDTNLQCHVLTQPCVGPHYIKNNPIGVLRLRTRHQSSNLGTWAQAVATLTLPNQKTMPTYAPTIRYSAVTGAVNVAEMHTPLRDGIYKADEPVKFNGRNEDFQVWYYFVVNTTYDANYYVFPIGVKSFDAVTDGDTLKKWFETRTTKPSLADVAEKLGKLSYAKHGDQYIWETNTYNSNQWVQNQTFIPVLLFKREKNARERLMSSSSFEIISGCNQNRVTMEDVIRMAPPVEGEPRVVFGEKPVDIKDACRRKNLVGLITLHGDGTHFVADEMIPVCIQYNANSEGLLSKFKLTNSQLYASGFLGFRGGLMYTIIPLRRENGLIGVQHVPDLKKIETQHGNAINQGVIANDVLLSYGYAQHWIDMNLNSNMSIEVPFYRNARWIFASQTKNLSDAEYTADCNGVLKIFSTSTEPVKCGIWVSFADDASLTYFQGFPPMSFVDEGLVPVVFNQIGERVLSPVVDKLDDFGAQIQPTLVGINMATTSISALSDTASTMLPSTLTKLSEAADSVSSLAESANGVIDKLPTGLASFLTNVRSKGVEIYDFMAQFAHVLIDIKSWKHWALFIGTFVLRWGVITRDKFMTLVDTIMRLFDREKSKLALDSDNEPMLPSNPFSGSESNIPRTKNEVNDDLYVTLGALLISGISAHATTKDKFWYLKSIPKFAVMAKTSATGFKWIKELITCIVDFVSDAIERLVMIWNPNVKLLSQGKCLEIKASKWYESCVPFLNPFAFESIKASSDRVAELSELILWGQRLSQYMADMHLDTRVIHLVQDTQKALVNLKQKLAGEFTYGPPLEPFCVWMSGDGGIGKTYVQDHFLVNLLSSQKISVENREMVFTVPAKGDYWERCNNQPVCVYDDFLVYKDDQTSRDQITTFLALKNKAPFSPPIAECEGKKKLYNPDIVWVNANWDEIRSSALASKAAFHRRRDVIIRAKLHPYLEQHGYSRYAEIPRHSYDEFCKRDCFKMIQIQPKPGSSAFFYDAPMTQEHFDTQVSRKEEYDVVATYIIPSPHLRFDIYTTKGDDELVLRASDQNSVEAAFALNTVFCAHRRDQLALMRRHVALESALNVSGIPSSVIPTTEHHNGKVEHPKVDGAIKTEVIIANMLKDKGYYQDAITKLNGGSVAFNNDYFKPKFTPNLTVEDLPVVNKNDTAAIFTSKPVVNTMTKLKDNFAAIKDNFVRTKNQGPQEDNPKPSTSKLGYLETAEAIANGTYDSSYMMSMEELVEECTRREEAEPRTPKVVVNGEDLSLDYPVNHNIELVVQKKQDIFDYQTEIAGNSEEIREFINEIYDLKDNREKAEQLRGICTHSLFDPKCMYDYGFFYGFANKAKTHKIIISDRPCPYKTTEKCPWHDRVRFQSDMNDFLGYHPEVGDYIYKSVDEMDEVRIYPYYFREKAKHTYANILLLRNADKNWLSYVKKLVVKDVPEALLTAWNWTKAHAGMIIAFLGIVCTIASTLVGIKNSLNFNSAFDKANSMHKLAPHMTQEEKIALRDAFTAISHARMTNDGGRLKATVDVLNNMTDVINARMLGINDNQIINSGSQPLARTKLGNKASAILKTTKSQRASEDGVEALKKKIRRNTFWLMAADKSTPLTPDFGLPMRCLGICEHWALMPTHYLEWWKDQDHNQKELRGCVGNGVFKWPMDWLDITEIPGSGLCVMEVPKQIPPFANILKSIPYSAEDFDYCDLSSVELLETVTSEIMNTHYGKSQIKMFFSQGDTPSQKETLIQAGFEYNIPTKPGFCGSVLLCGDKIIGMHVSGDMVQKGPQRLGYSSAIIGEELYPLFGLERGKSKVYDYYELYGDEELQSVTAGKVFPKTSVVPIGTLKKHRNELSIFVPGKTSWQKSVMHGVFPSRKSPAVLSPRDERIKDAPFSPLLEAINKHGLVPTPFPKVLFGIAKDYWINKHIQLMIPYGRKPGLLSLEQAICGIPGLNYYDKLEFNSSEGWPFCKARPPGARNKKWLFETEMIDNQLRLKSIYPPLKDQILNKIEETRENLNGFNVVVDLLKDELKPNEKVLIPGKTRCFSGAAVDEVIRFKMFYQDYVANYMKYRFHNSSAIGMSCVGREPTVLVNHMISKGFTKHCCGDYSDFGPAFEPNCGSVFYEIAIAWYEAHTPQGLRNGTFHDDQIARKNMGYSFTNPKHLAVDTIYQTMCGMSSGCPATAPCNTDVNKMYIAIAWLAITRTDLQTFEENVILMCYGDDIWFSVSDTFCEIFNNETLHHFFKKFEIKYTDNTKDKNNIRKYCSLEEVEFLKRKYIPHPTRRGDFLAALDKTSIEECCQWIQKDPSNLSLTKQICESAIELAYSHGKEYYAHVVKTIRDKWQTVLDAPPLALRSWDELDRIFYGELSGITQTFDDSWEAPMERSFCELRYVEGEGKPSCSHLGEECPFCCAPKLSTGAAISGCPSP
ncbi:MAG: polyprotein [Teucrium fruticans iflaviridae]|nr:MAG: polyprotein [Teucrium fruticans iflaviridae]